MKESAFRAKVKRDLERLGCYVRVNEAHFLHGFPDLTILTPLGQVKFIELKVSGNDLTKLQVKTLRDLARFNVPAWAAWHAGGDRVTLRTMASNPYHEGIQFTSYQNFLQLCYK